MRTPPLIVNVKYGQPQDGAQFRKVTPDKMGAESSLFKRCATGGGGLVFENFQSTRHFGMAGTVGFGLSDDLLRIHQRGNRLWSRSVMKIANGFDVISVRVCWMRAHSAVVTFTLGMPKSLVQISLCISDYLLRPSFSPLYTCAILAQAQEGQICFSSRLRALSQNCQRVTVR